MNCRMDICRCAMRPVENAKNAVQRTANMTPAAHIGRKSGLPEEAEWVVAAASGDERQAHSRGWSNKFRLTTAAAQSVYLGRIGIRGRRRRPAARSALAGAQQSAEMSHRPSNSSTPPARETPSSHMACPRQSERRASGRTSSIDLIGRFSQLRSLVRHGPTARPRLAEVVKKCGGRRAYSTSGT